MLYFGNHTYRSAISLSSAWGKQFCPSARMCLIRSSSVIEKQLDFSLDIWHRWCNNKFEHLMCATVKASPFTSISLSPMYTDWLVNRCFDTDLITPWLLHLCCTYTDHYVGSSLFHLHLYCVCLPEEVKYLLRWSSPSSSSGLKDMSTPRCLLPWPLFSLGIPAPCPAPPTTDTSLSTSLSSVSSSAMSQLSTLEYTVRDVC